MPSKKARNKKANIAKNKVGHDLPSAKQLRKLKPNEKFPLPEKPFVSICTPTFNRRPFIPYLIKCIELQDYPKELIEWIVIDDGTDPIEDLVSDLSYCKYFKYDTKMSLGKKRNLMHAKSKGDVLVYMDDDDYYPPERISHAVDTLKKNKRALAAGSSRINLYFKHIQKVYEFGPYGPQHATAGTFALKRQILNFTRYVDDRAIAEEKKFLLDYAMPLVQLDPDKTIFVFSHEHNTFDKRKLLENINPKVTRETDRNARDYIHDEELYDFYINKVDDILKGYEPGEPKNKPDVIEQTRQIGEERKKMREQMIEQEKARINNQPISIKDKDGKDKQLTNVQVIELLQNMQKELQSRTQQHQTITQQLDMYKAVIKSRDEKITSLKNEMEELRKELEQSKRDEITANYTNSSSPKSGEDNTNQENEAEEEITISIG